MTEFVAVADQRVCIPVEGRQRDGDRKWVSLRDLLRNHLGSLHNVSDEEQVALALMGQEPAVWLEAQGGVDGVARTFFMRGALDIDPHLNHEEKIEMETNKTVFVWNTVQAGLFLRYPLGVQASGTDVDYGGFQ